MRLFASWELVGAGTAWEEGIFDELGALLLWGDGDGVRTERTESGVEAAELTVALTGVDMRASSSSRGRFCGIGAMGVGSSIMSKADCVAWRPSQGFRVLKEGG